MRRRVVRNCDAKSQCATMHGTNVRNVRNEWMYPVSSVFLFLLYSSSSRLTAINHMHDEIVARCDVASWRDATSCRVNVATRGQNPLWAVRAPDARGVRLSRTKTPEALRRLLLAHRTFNFTRGQHSEGQETLPGYHDQSVSGVRKLRERSLGAETVRGLGVQMAGSPECVAGTDARGLAAAARLTLRGTPHTHTRAEPDTTERGSKEH
ncbi:hypothetical protein EVAR_85068_1 [Eumeta japonica]|uniref:Uncharacterized protein n=1 Tax=Eumeta variegata TaxID=151549 RepID=A0A4C1XBM2_EUMVA|nr:hypothetical protein EVAR_85068_1 [Eumeta japonica]